MNDLAKNESPLADAVRASALEFLKVELKIGNTMLDLAAATDERETNARRRAQAQEACSTVKRYLHEPPVPLSAEDRQAIGEGLNALEKRISASS
jgi:molecular chaperone DnaK (HSP70)